jgi:uncharacterized membrane protein
MPIVAFYNIFSHIEIFLNLHNYKIVTKTKMKTKFLSLILMTAILMTILMTVTMVSAADLISVTSPADFTKTRETVSFEIENIAGDTIELTVDSVDRVIKDNENREITISVDDYDGTLVDEGTITINAEITIADGFDFDDIDLGEHLSSTVTIDAVDGEDTETETRILYFINGFCDVGEFGELEIIELKDKKKDNEDEWEWHPLDDIEFRVEIENNFDDKERIKIEYEIYDDEGKRVDFNGDDNEQSVSIGDGDSERITFSLRVPADMEDGDYNLFLKAFVKGHEDDEGCVDSSNELSKTYYQEISVDRDEDRAVVVDLDKLDLPDLTMCGDFVTLYTKIYNIGEEDEDKVKVNLFNSELGIDLNEVINDLEEGEPATVTFNFQVPENVEEKVYLFRIINFYEYDEDDDEYDSNSKEDLDENFNFNLKVNCIQEKEISALITAELESDAVAGEPLVIKGTIKNTGEEETTYTLRIAEHSSWSDFDKIDPSTVTLDVDESADFDVQLNVDEDAEGEQFFVIKAGYNGETTEQEVSVLIEGTEGVSVTGSAVSGHLRENWFIWLIVVINIILIIAIIAVARRIVTTR